MRGQRKPRKIDIIREQSETIVDMQRMLINQGNFILQLLEENKKLNERLNSSN